MYGMYCIHITYITLSIDKKMCKLLIAGFHQKLFNIMYKCALSLQNTPPPPISNHSTLGFFILYISQFLQVCVFFHCHPNSCFDIFIAFFCFLIKFDFFFGLLLCLTIICYNHNHIVFILYLYCNLYLKKMFLILLNSYTTITTTIC